MLCDDCFFSFYITVNWNLFLAFWLDKKTRDCILGSGKIEKYTYLINVLENSGNNSTLHFTSVTFFFLSIHQYPCRVAVVDSSSAHSRQGTPRKGRVDTNSVDRQTFTARNQSTHADTGRTYTLLIEKPPTSKRVQTQDLLAMSPFVYCCILCGKPTWLCPSYMNCHVKMSY